MKTKSLVGLSLMFLGIILILFGVYGSIQGATYCFSNPPFWDVSPERELGQDYLFYL
jgi:hypothetical protein